MDPDEPKWFTWQRCCPCHHSWKATVPSLSPDHTLSVLFRHYFNIQYLACYSWQCCDHPIGRRVASSPPSSIPRYSDIMNTIIFWFIELFGFPGSICHASSCFSLSNITNCSNMVTIWVFIHWCQHIQNTCEFNKTLVSNSNVPCCKNNSAVDVKGLASIDFSRSIKTFRVFTLSWCTFQHKKGSKTHLRVLIFLENNMTIPAEWTQKWDKYCSEYGDVNEAKTLWSFGLILTRTFRRIARVLFQLFHGSRQCLRLSMDRIRCGLFWHHNFIVRVLSFTFFCRSYCWFIFV